jgi:hypothetical protein
LSDFAALREKAAKDYLFFITEGRQNPKLGTVYNMFADYLTKTGEAWQSCVSFFVLKWIFFFLLTLSVFSFQ